MRDVGHGRPARVFIWLFIAGVVATWGVGEALDRHETTHRDRDEVAHITNKMKTVCIGRFSIDMPAQAQVELGQARINGFNIAAFEESTEACQKRLNDREAQLRAKPDRLGGEEEPGIGAEHRNRQRSRGENIRAWSYGN